MMQLIDIIAAGLRDDSGNVLASGTVTVYEAGTTTSISIYADYEALTPLSNPVTLDSVGRKDVWVDRRTKLLIKNSGGSTIRTIDDVGVSDAQIATAAGGLVAGNGLSSSSGSLSVNVDDDTIEIDSDTLRVKAQGIGPAYLSDLAVSGVDSFNIGLTYSAGTLTVTGSDGTALSASNPGIVVLKNKTAPWQSKVYQITAAQSFVDDAGTSEIVGNLFGTTTSVAWANDCPFFLYAVSNDSQDAIAFMISRDPRATVAPSEANIGAPDDAVADAQGSFFSFENIDESLYDGNPCVCLGAFRMRKTSSDDWTVQSFTAADGIGRFHSSTKFSFPVSQNGAATGTHLKANGGTAPLFNSNVYYYWIRKDGTCLINLRLEADPGAGDGAGTVTAVVSTPYTINLGSDALVVFGTARVRGEGTDILCHVQPFTAGAGFSLVNATTANSLNNDDFENGDRHILTTVSFPAFSD